MQNHAFIKYTWYYFFHNFPLLIAGCECIITRSPTEQCIATVTGNVSSTMWGGGVKNVDSTLRITVYKSGLRTVQNLRAFLRGIWV